MPPRRPGSRSNPDAVAEIKLQAQRTSLSAEAIIKNMDKREEFQKDPIPLRTAERIVAQVREKEKGKVQWNVTDSNGDDARLVLAARKAEIESQVPSTAAGPVYYWLPLPFSTRLAKSITAVLRATPDLPLNVVASVASVYGSAIRDGDKETAEAVTDYLAFAPWRDEQHYQEYCQMVQQKALRPVPRWAVFVESLNPSLTPAARDELRRKYRVGYEAPEEKGDANA